MEKAIVQIRQNFDKYGHSCSVTCRDLQTIIISDIFTVSQDELEFILSKLPQSDFVIEYSEHSKSNIIVVVTLYETIPFFEKTFFLHKKRFLCLGTIFSVSKISFMHKNRLFFF